MRTISSLLTVMLLLIPTIGTLLTVDAPLYVEDNNSDVDMDTILNSHGTRSYPEENPYFIYLYFHRQSPVQPGLVMNTSSDFRFSNPGSANSPTTFILEETLYDDMWVGDPPGDAGMRAHVYLTGLAGDSVTLTITDNQGGTELGQATYTYVSLHSSTPVDIIIPFHPQFDHNYTFPTGNSTVMEATFTGNAAIGYDHDTQPSYLRLFCAPVTDIKVATMNFNNEPTKTFYPNNIDFPVNRRVVQIEGEITDVFRKWDKKYIQNAEVNISLNGTTVDQGIAALDRDSWKYAYEWVYSKGVDEGEYTVMVTVTDEQDNAFTTRYSFNMSLYGVLLTSPDQKGGEGSYTMELAKATRKVIQYTTTAYKINVRNIGNADTIVNLTTNGPLSWDWWLEGVNLTKNDGSKNDTVTLIAPGEKREILLFVDSKDRSPGAKATITVTAECTEDPVRTSDLLTITTVIYFQLAPGWNLVSVPFIQSNSDINAVLSSISMSYDAVQWYNANDTSDPWKHHHTSKPPNLNDLNSIDHTMGFWIHITDPGGVSFDYSGTPPTENQTLALKPGWNHIGYPSLTYRDRTAALNNLTFGLEVDAIWTFNAATQKWDEISGGDYFEVGRGYWIHATQECVWEVGV